MLKQQVYQWVLPLMSESKKHRVQELQKQPVLVKASEFPLQEVSQAVSASRPLCWQAEASVYLHLLLSVQA